MSQSENAPKRSKEETKFDSWTLGVCSWSLMVESISELKSLMEALG